MTVGKVSRKYFIFGKYKFMSALDVKKVYEEIKRLKIEIQRLEESMLPEKGLGEEEWKELLKEHEETKKTGVRLEDLPEES